MDSDRWGSGGSGEREKARAVFFVVLSEHHVLAGLKAVWGRGVGAGGKGGRGHVAFITFQHLEKWSGQAGWNT